MCKQSLNTTKNTYNLPATDVVAKEMTFAEEDILSNSLPYQKKENLQTSFSVTCKYHLKTFHGDEHCRMT